MLVTRRFGGSRGAELHRAQAARRPFAPRWRGDSVGTAWRAYTLRARGPCPPNPRAASTLVAVRQCAIPRALRRIGSRGAARRRISAPGESDAHKCANGVGCSAFGARRPVGCARRCRMENDARRGASAQAASRVARDHARRSARGLAACKRASRRSGRPAPEPAHRHNGRPSNAVSNAVATPTAYGFRVPRRGSATSGSSGQ